jgi:hypothetical protein
MASQQSKTTTDHDEIRRWAEKRGGSPAAVARTGGRRGSGDPGILRIDFPGFSGEGSLRPISWEQFFDAFDANELALVYRERDRFNKLVSRETAGARARGQRRASRPKAASSSRRRTGATKRKPTTRRRASGRHRER